MGKTFRKIRGKGNFKSIIFGESHQALEVFKQPSHKNNASVIEPNEKYTHNIHTWPNFTQLAQPHFTQLAQQVGRVS